MHRLFVALRPPASVRARLLGLMEGVAGARWQDDEQLHLTLAFIGEVQRPVAEDIAAALDRVQQPRPAVALRGIGLFGPEGRPHSLWAGCAPDPALSLLQQRVMRALAQAGQPLPTRAFHPHVTLARLNRASGPAEPFLGRHAGLALPPFEADAFFLFESELGRSGATYHAVARYSLAA
jgi:2'-5' RNA ligase